jgi:hypothetical protein
MHPGGIKFTESCLKHGMAEQYPLSHLCFHFLSRLPMICSDFSDSSIWIAREKPDSFNILFDFPPLPYYLEHIRKSKRLSVDCFYGSGHQFHQRCEKSSQ